MPYRQTTSNDYWVDDVNSPLYNTWQEGSKSPVIVMGSINQVLGM